MVSPDKVLVYHPLGRIAERRYILQVVLGDFLGLDYECCACSDIRTVLAVPSVGHKQTLILEDVFFRLPETSWLRESSMPSRPLRVWEVASDVPEARVAAPKIPIIYGDTAPNRPLFDQSESGIHLALDIFGSAFFMLTRYEEMVNPERDEHGRFRATSSLAYSEGFLERPIIDEYVEILWACIHRLWPQLERSARTYSLVLSHDVDHPLAVLNRSWADVLRSAVGDVAKRRDVTLAWNRLCARRGADGSGLEKDPYNTFDFLMDVSESHGLVSSFYFITAHTGHNGIDGSYSVDHPWIGNLMKRIHSRGHEIGLHGSYESYQDGDQIRHEFNRLLEVTGRNGIRRSRWSSRQHYLRWETPVTWRILAAAGLEYDSTLAYADHVGFRCGVCRGFRAFDLCSGTTLNIIERPLIVMDGSLTGSRYMNLRPSQLPAVMHRIAQRCMTVAGELTFLCHNSTLMTVQARELYLEILRACIR